MPIREASADPRLMLPADLSLDPSKQGRVNTPKVRLKLSELAAIITELIRQREHTQPLQNSRQTSKPAVS